MTLPAAQLDQRRMAYEAYEAMRRAGRETAGRRIAEAGGLAALERQLAIRNNALKTNTNQPETSIPVLAVNEDNAWAEFHKTNPRETAILRTVKDKNVGQTRLSTEPLEPEIINYSEDDGWNAFEDLRAQSEPHLFSPTANVRLVPVTREEGNVYRIERSAAAFSTDPINEKSTDPVDDFPSGLRDGLRARVAKLDGALWAGYKNITKGLITTAWTLDGALTEGYRLGATRLISGAFTLDQHLNTVYGTALTAGHKTAVKAAGAVGAASITIAIGASAFHGHHGKSLTEAHYIIDARPSAVPNVIFEAPAAATLPDGVLQSSDALMAVPARQELTRAEKTSGYHKVAMIAIDAALKSNLFPVMAQAAYETHTTVANILAMINIESKVDTKAVNQKSSSVGLLQIVDETFIGMVSNHWHELKQPLSSILPEHPSLVSMLERVRISAQKAQRATADGHIHLDMVAKNYAQSWHHLSQKELTQAKREGLSGNLLHDIKVARQNPAVSVFFAFKQIQHEYRTLPKNVQNRLGTNGTIRCLIFLGRGQTIALANAPGHKHINHVLRHAVLQANNIPKTLTVDQLIDDIRGPYEGQVEAIQAALKSSPRPELRTYSMASNINGISQSAPRPSAG